MRGLLLVGLVAIGCGDDSSMLDDAGGLDASVDASFDALDPDAGENSLQPRVDEVLAAYEPWVAAGWYDTVVVGMREGDLEAYAGFGSVGGSSVGADTPYEIGSITKTFTGLLLADAIERGEVTLDTPLGDLVSGTIPTGPSGGQIFLRHLTTHSSGLPTFPDDIEGTALDAISTYDDTDLFAWLETFELPREPGEGFEYSNMAVGLLGYGVARASGSTYETLLRERVLDPMGLENSTLEPVSNAPEPRDHLMRPVSPLALTEVFSGAGELRSTARELMQYARYQLHPEEAEGTLTNAIAASHEPVATIESIAVGFNWFFRDSAEVIWHNGATDGFAAYFAFVPSEDRAVTVLTNVRNHTEHGTHYVWALDALREADPIYREPPVDHVIEDLAVLDDYVGAYDLAGMRTEVTRADDHAEIRVEGQPAFPLFARDVDTFYLRIVDAQITFLRDDAGLVYAFELFQMGRVEAPRIEE